MMNSHAGFYREYPARPDSAISNQTEDHNRWRVNDTDIGRITEWAHRWETQANGLMLIAVPEKVTQLRAAELELEMWGGHPRTRNKDVIVNGRGIYALPEVGTAAGNCTYCYPIIALDLKDLVGGVNAFQYRCERGESFWGHYILDHALLRCYYPADHPSLASADGFAPRVMAEVSGDEVWLALEDAAAFKDRIVRVAYLGQYLDYDDRGEGCDDGWHGFKHGGEWKNHLGSAEEWPFRKTWRLNRIPNQPRMPQVCAEVELVDGLRYRTAPVEIAFPARAYDVHLVRPRTMSVPFWSRAGEQKEAVIPVAFDPSRIEKAWLYVKIWDGGEGTVANPFQVNGHAYAVTSRQAVHDVVFTETEIDVSHLRPGDNCTTLLSDTEHHGIEVLLPGPCLKLRVRA